MKEQIEDEQDLYFEDFTTFKGRISRANFRALNLLVLGVAICIYFLPGFANQIIILEVELNLFTKSIKFLISPIHIVGYILLLIFYLLLSVKRMRDTGNPLWKLLIPFYNLKILFFEESKI